MSNSEIKKRLWLPWKYTDDGGHEVRLTSDDVYDALGEARKTILFTMHQRDCPSEMQDIKKRTIAVLQTLEDGLRSMFAETLKSTPSLMIPKEKP